MKTKKFLFMMLALICAFGIVSCKDDEKEENKTSLSVNVYDLVLGSTGNSVSNFTLTSNAPWTITGIPEWVNLSSTRGGAGTATITVVATSTNSSSKDRVATINVTAAEVTIDVEITQKANLIGDCEVCPIDVLVMNESVAFDFRFGKNVSYYYYGYIESRLSGSMTDEDIAEYAEENFPRYTPDEDLLGVLEGLDSNTQYDIVCFGYDNKGNRGEMTRVQAKTKNDFTNRPRVTIDGVGYDDDTWFWSTIISPYATRYYMIYAEDIYADYHLLLSDAEVAWGMKEKIEDGTYAPIVNDGEWVGDRSPGSSSLYIAVWAVGASDKFSGELDKFYGSIESEVVVNKAASKVQSDKIRSSSKKMLREFIEKSLYEIR